MPNSRDPYQFILDLDGVLMTFQLSLCGPLDGRDEVEDTNKFESSQVSYRKFMARPSLAAHDDLVIRWADK